MTLRALERGYRIRVLIEETDADIKCGVVIQDTHLGLIGSFLPRLGITLDEASRRLGRLPRGLVEPTVEVDLPGAARGHHDPEGGGVDYRPGGGRGVLRA